MERYRVHFTYRGGRFDGRKGKRTVRANNKEEAGSRVSYLLNHPKRVAYSMRYITVDSIEILPQENK
jgi:hypothetical protein